MSANYCRQCGNRLSPNDRFCGSCGAPADTQAAPHQAFARDEVPARRPDGSRSSGGLFGCFFVLLILAGGAGAAWYYLVYLDNKQTNQAGPSKSLPELPASSVEDIKEDEVHLPNGEPLLPQIPAANKDRANPPAERASASMTRESAPPRSPESLQDLWAGARNPALPLNKRLAAIAELRTVPNLNDEELRELKILQSRAMAELEGLMRRELQARAEFVDEAAKGVWLEKAEKESDDVMQKIRQQSSKK